MDSEEAVEEGAEERLARLERAGRYGHRLNEIAIGDLRFNRAGGGSRVPPGLRHRMQAALGLDLSGVRVHQDRSPELLDAEAYAQGSDLHFAPGRFQPHSAFGRRLLAHELAHLAQRRRRRTVGPGSGPIDADPVAEAQAEALGRRALLGLPARPGNGMTPAAGRAAARPAPIQRSNGKKGEKGKKAKRQRTAARAADQPDIRSLFATARRGAAAATSSGASGAGAPSAGPPAWAPPDLPAALATTTTTTTASSLSAAPIEAGPVAATPPGLSATPPASRRGKRRHPESSSSSSGAGSAGPTGAEDLDPSTATTSSHERPATVHPFFGPRSEALASSREALRGRYGQLADVPDPWIEPIPEGANRGGPPVLLRPPPLDYDPDVHGPADTSTPDYFLSDVGRDTYRIGSSDRDYPITDEDRSDVRNYARLSNAYLSHVGGVDDVPEERRADLERRAAEVRRGLAGAGFGRGRGRGRGTVSRLHVPDASVSGVPHSAMGWMAGSQTANTLVGGAQRRRNVGPGQRARRFLVRERDGRPVEYRLPPRAGGAAAAATAIPSPAAGATSSSGGATSSSSAVATTSTTTTYTGPSGPAAEEIDEEEG